MTREITVKQAMEMLGITSETAFRGIRDRHGITHTRRAGNKMFYNAEDFEELASLRKNKYTKYPVLKRDDPLRVHSKEQRKSACLRVWELIYSDMAKQRFSLPMLSKKAGHEHLSIYLFAKRGKSIHAMYIFYNIARALGFSDTERYVVKYIEYLEEMGFSEASFYKPEDY